MCIQVKENTRKTWDHSTSLRGQSLKGADDPIPRESGRGLKLCLGVNGSVILSTFAGHLPKCGSWMHTIAKPFRVETRDIPCRCPRCKRPSYWSRYHEWRPDLFSKGQQKTQKNNNAHKKALYMLVPMTTRKFSCSMDKTSGWRALRICKWRWLMGISTLRALALLKTGSAKRVVSY